MDSLLNEKNHKYIMNCKHCNSTWNTSSQVKNCPFCGKLLVDDNKYTVTTALKSIIDNNGIDILKNPKRLMSYIVDYVQGEDKEKRLLKIAYDSGVLKIAYEIKCISESEQQLILVHKAKQLLENEAFLSEDNAKLILNIIMTGLDISCGDILKMTNKVEYSSADKPIEIETDQYSETNTTDASDLENVYENAIHAYGEQKYSEAFNLTFQVASQNHAKAQDCLGYLYEYGKGVAQDYQKAAEWYEKAASQNNALAQYHIGHMYEIGKGVAQDYKKATEWYEKAANQNESRAQFKLGIIYQLNENYQKAIEWYEKAANQNHWEAPYFLGRLYEHGKGVAQDYKKAARWYEKAANQNHITAQNCLGRLYENGQGLTRDYKKAAEWYEKAASQNNPSSQYNLGRLYEHGEGVAQNYKKAIELYEKAASQKHPVALYSLGCLYATGRGVSQDYKKAINYFKNAEEQGYRDAKWQAETELGICIPTC